MTLTPISDSYARELKKIFTQRKKEFEPLGMVIDPPHLLARAAAENGILLLEERALREGQAIWYLAYPHDIATVRQKAKNRLQWSYKIGARNKSRESLLVCISVNELIAAEARVA
jgi:hypothetical protein